MVFIVLSKHLMYDKEKGVYYIAGADVVNVCKDLKTAVDSIHTYAKDLEEAGIYDNTLFVDDLRTGSDFTLNINVNGVSRMVEDITILSRTIK